MKVCLTRDEFEKVPARFYDAEGTESLEYEDVKSYFESFFPEDLAGLTEDAVDAVARRVAPFRVVAFEPKLTDDEKRARWCRAVADSMAQTLGEQHYEDLGEPDADSPDLNEDERTQLTAFVGRWLARVGVWQCDQVAVYEYTAEDIRAVLGAP
jgi:hypothetical protein